MENDELKKVARNVANIKYRGKAYDRISFDVKKGTRDIWKQAAAARGLGQNEMIRLSVDEYIQNHPVKEE